MPLLQRWDHPAVTRALCMVLLSPSLVLVDHGHFQYNCVCLGLAVAAAAAVASGKRRGGDWLVLPWDCHGIHWYYHR